MRKSRSLVLLLPILLLIGVLTPNAVYATPLTATLGSSDDSYVASGGPTENYGTVWCISSAQDYFHGLVRFDLSSIPSGSVITSATLKLYAYYVWWGGTAYAYRITEDWSEDTVTWNTRPGNEATATASAALANGWMTWDVTTDVQAFVSGTMTNYGWKLLTGGNVAWCAKEYDSLDPVLEVTYKLPTTMTVSCVPDSVKPGESTIIGGQLTSDGSGLSGKPVDLYYAPADSATGEPTGPWTKIDTVTTGGGGEYSYTWYPPGAVGDYWAVNATFAGDSDYEGSSAKTGTMLIPNVHVIPEVPLGNVAILASMTLALAVMMLSRRKTLRFPFA